MGLDIFNVQFDYLKNIMVTRCQFFYKWNDPKMVWDSENYDNIRELPMLDHNIWYPILRFSKWVKVLFGILKFPINFNHFSSSGVGLKNADTSNQLSQSIIYNNGTVKSKSKPYEISTWCSISSAKVWPHELVQCHINITLANALKVRLNSLKNHKAIIQQSENSHWSISTVDLTIPIRSKFSTMVYTIVLTRNEAFIDSLFGTPLNVTLILLMASIFVQDSLYRLLLILLPTVMLFISFIVLTKNIPPFYAPLIGEFDWLGNYIYYNFLNPFQFNSTASPFCWPWSDSFATLLPRILRTFLRRLLLQIGLFRCRITVYWVISIVLCPLYRWVLW